MECSGPDLPERAAPGRAPLAPPARLASSAHLAVLLRTKRDPELPGAFHPAAAEQAAFRVCAAGFGATLCWRWGRWARGRPRRCLEARSTWQSGGGLNTQLEEPPARQGARRPAPRRSLPACSKCGCRCGEQSAKYPYRSSEDYHEAHPAVKAIAEWRRQAQQPLPEVHQAPSPLGYRTRGKMAVGPAGGSGPGSGAAVIGLFRRGTWQVLPLQGCAANHPRLNAAMGVLQAALDELRSEVRPFEHDADEPWRLTEAALRYVELTLERATGLVQLVLVWNGRRPSASFGRLLEYLWPAADAGGSGPWHSIWAHFREPDPSLLRAIHSKRPDAWQCYRTLKADALASGVAEEPDPGQRDQVVETLDGFQFSFGPASFQQANLVVFETILRDMKDALRDLEPALTTPTGGGAEASSGPLRLLELCGGVGVIGLSLAHDAARWVGGRGVTLESTDVNPNCAEPFASNARRCALAARGTSGAGAAAVGAPPAGHAGGPVPLPVTRFRAFSAAQALRQLAAGQAVDTVGRGPSAGEEVEEEVAHSPADVLIIDPPRRGLARNEYRLGLYGGEEEARAIRGSSVRAVIYMSCGHQSFMMDADRLTGADASASGPGWGPPFRLVSLRCYDMFPFTPHIETLGVFVREATGAGAVSDKAAPRRASTGPRSRVRRIDPRFLGEKFQCYFLVGIEQDARFRVVGRLLGRGGENMRRIAGASGAKLRLRGRGSGFLEGRPRRESEDPLMLCVSAPDAAAHASARRLCEELLEGVQESYRTFCASTGLPLPADLSALPRDGPRPGAHEGAAGARK